ncbi:hypothetical protein LZ198_07010 [Myxococcus sp. K15C18031901]|uniref:hypothetical protein n=1 Tax=Myxococcus dinghuensis TaxID=2906761 RepID=UPI0020A746F2|nr:hypothetical protein [Myxococcus dinghuensis]MCP3098624.1 hypothetical protein [Myxococcus dinghuensis]
MSRRPVSLLMAACLVLPGFASAAEGGELTPEKVAQIRRDEAAAMKKVSAEFGDRKSSEMSNEERGQQAAKQAGATASVLEKHGVSAKEYERFAAKMGREGNERAAAENQRLETQEKSAKQAAAKPAEEKEVTIQAGFSNANPVELESLEGDAPVVEIGIPVEDEDGEDGDDEAMEAGGAGGGGAVGAEAAADTNNIPVQIGTDESVKPAKKAPHRSNTETKKAKKKYSRKKSSNAD